MGRILSFFSNEAQLVKALRKDDPKAQRQVYDKYSARMLGLCFRYISDDMAAEDVMVEGFLKVFGKIDQFSGEGSFEGWIRRIMVNEALGYLRRQKRILEDTLSEEAVNIPDYASADQHLEAEELLKLIEELPVGYRTVFNLYAIEGYAHIEIAQMLGVTESTSKSQLHRARAMLQKMVSDWDRDLKKKVAYEKASC
ncbi:RNA polymerase sigma factor [Dyadobacter sediminis]|uniref:RNA polymerase sigma factor n=1 Tax=Dyadobacter sediminis TaxID=1493691 RepID=A0A5R9K7K7_9BACT|nr:RNA polymerase sigma factor [Dyadobacter sediminis]TLU89849.1 RNA polymerase sigma factor [Dyadobacter sediminis]GGC12315.1 DNA-directed RNA polymerase sigma-70 factor [Dyadobacter sediminis]